MTCNILLNFILFLYTNSYYFRSEHLGILPYLNPLRYKRISFDNIY